MGPIVVDGQSPCGRPMEQPPRLRKRAEFLRVQTSGKRFRRPTLLLVIAKSESTRVGYTVSRKVGGAVVRNRVRRRLKEIVRAQPNALCNCFDHVFIASPRAVGQSFQNLERDVLAVLAEARGWVLQQPSSSP